MDKRRVLAVSVAFGVGAYLLIEVLSVAFMLGLVNVLPGELALVLGASLAYAGGAGGAYLLFVDLLERPLNYAKLHMPSFEDVVWIVVGFVAMFGVLLAVSLFAEFVINVEPAEHGLIEPVQENPRLALYLLPLVALVVGPAEELVYRGLVQTHLSEAYDAWFAIGFSSLIFAVVHVGAYSALAESIGQTMIPLFLIFLVSLIMGWLYHRQQNLIVPIVLHAVFNGLQMVVLYLDAVYDLNGMS